MVTDSASNMIKAFNLPEFDESAGEEEGEEEVPETQRMVNLSHWDTYITKNNLHMWCPIHLQQLALKKR